MALQYREVTGFFTARIPDSGDADLNPDTVPLTGNVTFHPEYRKPLVFPGEHIVLEPINAIIIDGQLMVEVIQGEDVVLQSLHLPVTMDERANQTWSWTMRFHGMTLGQYGETVELPDARFVIEEGSGPLDLSSVAGQWTGGGLITRGAPGPGLQNITAQDGKITFAWDNGNSTTIPVPDAVPGPKGDPGDVRFEGIDPGITVRTNDVLIGDTTVPTTALATPTTNGLMASQDKSLLDGIAGLVYDSGWRNVTGELSNGWGGAMFVRRAGRDIYLRGKLDAATATASGAWAIPSGFRGGTLVAGGVYDYGGALAWTETTSPTVRRLNFYNNSVSVVGRNAGETITVAVNYVTTDSPPATLPGAPA